MIVVTQRFQQNQGYTRRYRGSIQECTLLSVTSVILRLMNLEGCVPENPFCRAICRLVSASHCDACSLDRISGYGVAVVENSCVILNATSSCSGAPITEHTRNHTILDANIRKSTSMILICHHNYCICMCSYGSNTSLKTDTSFSACQKICFHRLGLFWRLISCTQDLLADVFSRND